MTQVPIITETSPLICRTNQWTGLCMIETSVMKELKPIFDHLVMCVVGKSGNLIFYGVSNSCQNQFTFFRPGFVSFLKLTHLLGVI